MYNLHLFKNKTGILQGMYIKVIQNIKTIHFLDKFKRSLPGGLNKIHPTKHKNKVLFKNNYYMK